MRASTVWAAALLGLVLLAGQVPRAACQDEDDAPAAAGADSAAEAVAADALPPGFSEKEAELVKAGAEKFEFQAEVNRLMDIIINSLYSNREVFLRELISNAADALDKIRYLALTNKSLLGTDSEADLDVRVSFNKEARTLTVSDRGVGMTRDELRKHLGVVASSGTTAFVEAAAKGTDALQLIGQFGVGFYSVYLVADKVTVVSKHNDDDQHVWQSDAKGTFTISKDPRGNTLGRGTEVILHLKADASEYLDQATLERILQKYSQFVHFPILLHKMERVEREVPDEEAAAAEEPKKEGDDEDVDVADEEDKPAEEKKAKTKKVQVEEWSWKQMNSVKAIWTRKPADVTEEEYDEFFKALTKDQSGSLQHVHFSAEGEIAFKSLLYVPKVAAFDLYDKYYGKSTGLKLYVRRVLVAEEFDEFMPRYLNFIKGVVDSDDLPINVSRETLSKSKVLKVMGKKLTRKALEMLREMADAAEAKIDDDEAKAKAKAEREAKGEAEEPEPELDEEAKKAKENKDKEAGKFATFWSQYGKSVKLGVVEDSSNREKLSKLLRYPTTKSDTPVSLQRYVDRMPEDQKYIYYITGESLESVRVSPFLEKLNKKGFEVVYMVDPLDEYVMSNLQDFDGKKFMSVSKEGFKLDESKEAQKLEKRLKKSFAKFADWLKEVYGEKVEKVVVSNRIADSPCVLVTSQWGWSANMERIMKAQTFSDQERTKYMVAKKTLEINPRHPLIRELRARSEADPEGERVRDLAGLMFDAALLNSGFAVDNAADFASRIHRVMGSGLDLKEGSKVLSDEELKAEFAADADDEDDDSSKSDDADSDSGPLDIESEPINLDADEPAADEPRDEL